MTDNREKTLGAIDDLDNKGFFKSDCTILFYFGTNDDGERYVDAEMVTGHVIYIDREKHKDIADVIGAEDLAEALRMLIEKL